MPATPPEPDKTLQFIETKNRIGHEVEFEAAVPNGRLYLHPNKFTYAFHDGSGLHHHHETDKNHSASHSKNKNGVIKAHAYTVTFLGAAKAKISGSETTGTSYNYFLGNDKSKWVSGAKGYRKVDYNNLYPGIDMRLHEQNGKLKYEFFLDKGVDPNVIRMKYEGAKKLELKNGELIITTTVNRVTESRPYTYQIVDRKQKPVACNFVLSGKEVSFSFPDGYDTNLPLIIDPEMMYSTFSGSAADNWGFTATYDSLGMVYSGGIVFGTGFPQTTGAYDLTFNGPDTYKYDMGILKFNPYQSGTASLVYATYLGGNGSEAPHSLIVNNNNELLIFGTTGSADYPVTNQAFSQSFSGGASITPLTVGNNSVTHPNGVDMVISKLSSSGEALLASTYLGGSGTDGVLLTADSLVKNYGDQFRGDINVDKDDNVYIATSTSSSDFPNGSGQPGSLPVAGTDAVVCKLTPDLDLLLWSAAVGGSGMDAAYSIQLDSLNNVVICGGTTSHDFPVSPNSYSPVYNQGIDGFIARLSADGTTIQQATYLGTPQYDQAYFVQLDNAGNVYVFGQTQGNYPVSPGVYSVPNSKQFIHKFDYNLTTTIFSTVFGSPNGALNISPTAFLVNECNTIYASGWGGAINAGYIGGTTHNMPVTPGATQTTTDGSDFYLIALSDDAQSLVLGTYIGGAGVLEHVDGGTSRFDKKSANGIVYQAVCGGCGGSSNFPTTPGAWSEQNKSSNCNNAVFKFQIPELDAGLTPSLIFNGPRQNRICYPDTIYFRRESVSGVSFFWDFGDGTTSTLPGPFTHFYGQPGIYPVSLTVTDSTSCTVSVTAHDTIYVGLMPEIIMPDDIYFCYGELPVLDVAGSAHYEYLWSPATGLSNPAIANPTANPTESTMYHLTVRDAGCVITDSVLVTPVPKVEITTEEPANVCLGDSIQLQSTVASGFYTAWFPGNSLSNDSIANPVATPDSTTTYYLIAVGFGCTYKDSVQVTVNYPPQVQMPADTVICFGNLTSLNVIADAQLNFLWSPSAGLSDTTIARPLANPNTTTTYYLQATNAANCTVYDSVQVKVIPKAGVSTQQPAAVCSGSSIQLLALPATDFSYRWTPASTLSNDTVHNPFATPSATTTYFVEATGLNCTFYDSVTVVLLENPVPAASPGMPQGIAPYGFSFTNQSTGGTSYSWSFGNGATSAALNPSVNYTEPGIYPVILTATSAAGCTATDTVARVNVMPPFVPNIITPNGDGVNDVFVATISNQPLHLQIFNRWGNLLYETYDYQQDWGGNGVPDGVYFYFLSTPDGRSWKGWLEIMR